MEKYTIDEKDCNAILECVAEILNPTFSISLENLNSKLDISNILRERALFSSN